MSRPGGAGARHTARGRAVAVVAALAAVAGVAGCQGGSDGVADGRSATPIPTPSSGSDTTGPGSTTWTPGPSQSSGGSTGPSGAPAALGAKWDWGRYTEFQPYLRTLAGGRTYYEVVWCDVERDQGRPDWSSLDRIAERSRTVGVTLMLKLRVGTCWATGGSAQYERGSKGKTESLMPTDLAAYRAWVRSAVTRYSAKGVNAYAIENEINSKSFWGGTPEEFTTLAETASAEIRAANPDADVVDAGLSSTTYGYGIADALLRQGREADAIAAYNRYYQRRFGTRGDKIVEVRDRAGLEKALASEQGARNLTYLRLMSDLARRKVVDVRQIHFYESYASVPDLFAYLRASTPAGVPIEAWEVGRFDRDSGEDGTETVEMLKTVSLVVGEGARAALWLPLAFDPGGRNSDEPRFGLLEPDGSVREAGRVFQELLAASRGAKAVRISSGGMTGVGFERGGRTTAYVWAGQPVSVDLGKGETAQSPGATATRTGRVTVDGTPVRLVLDGTVKDFMEEQ
ncbi:hypothetical protein P0Y31_15405 [Knoellia sp. 3-2P3]|uniref:hypothetical protein n=1 Tax=unclassified Knoellia TaxID=2618719 RepID=UPI0023DC969B|nr:hypothetical protein [Knoellia sp. 3-2P3]MDF2093736.1 hypothetical protein [Knoellia sp. 3-2P3]